MKILETKTGTKYKIWYGIRSRIGKKPELERNKNRVETRIGKKPESERNQNKSQKIKME